MPKYKAKKKRKSKMTKNIRDKGYYILCQFRLGSFERERGVIIDIPDVGKITTIVDKSDLLPNRKPEPGQILEGKLKVFVVDQKDDKVIVDLPRETFTSGPRIAVPRTLLVAA
jgi:hypothetical protein